MPAVPRYANRLTLLVVAAACAAGAALILVQRGGAPIAANAASEAELGVLPTMKGHMGRLGTLMNVLFRSITDPNKTEAVLAATAEMQVHLERVGRTLVPTRVAAIQDAAAQDAALAGYKDCIDRSITQLDEIAAELRAQRFEQARQVLFKLDKLRRDCHSAYAS